MGPQRLFPKTHVPLPPIFLKRVLWLVTVDHGTTLIWPPCPAPSSSHSPPAAVSSHLLPNKLSDSNAHAASVRTRFQTASVSPTHLASAWPQEPDSCKRMDSRFLLLSSVSPETWWGVSALHQLRGSHTCPQRFCLPHSWAHVWPRVSHKRKMETSPPGAGSGSPNHIRVFVSEEG